MPKGDDPYLRKMTHKDVSASFMYLYIYLSQIVELAFLLHDSVSTKLPTPDIM